ncbi:UGSC family (seleno)protein [Citricoccus sp. I39-566]|uniref:UGSC family (seleno)protein n=1 Tax=Citricoccus sp. I39-566 TaxID=3073268 RepID=UPI00286CB8B3|nr:UGSC family (seleno)protein [Citricoccus sp. I39-566]WMY79666.1 UGSC family (seleno)protein [Citricoccus sp. I39-566]
MTAGILDPTISRSSTITTSDTRGTTIGTGTAPTGAPRVPELAGLRVGLLENTKRHAAEVLDAVGAALVEQHAEQPAGRRPIELVRLTKQNFAMPLEGELEERLVRDCDVVVIGVGDCGSCSAAAVADGIALEARGLPVAVVCTEAFDVTSRAMARLKGQSGFPYLLMPHPIANLTPDGIAERGRDLAARIGAHLTGAAA